MDQFSLKGKTAVVTGAATGLGAGIARTLAEAGAQVFLVDINIDGARARATELVDLGYKALAIQADLTSETSVDAAFAEVAAKGGVDVLVNNAGTYINVGGSILDQTPEFWRAGMRINLESVFLCSRRAAKLMVEQGRGGSIVNVSSVDAAVPALGVGYDTAKAAVNHMSRSLAVDLAGYGIRANCVAPGVIPVETFEKVMSGELPPLISPAGSASGLSGPVVMKRMEVVPRGELEDMGNAVLFFASNASKFVTGQTLYVDGGWTSM